jgi:hypothetical protein
MTDAEKLALRACLQRQACPDGEASTVLGGFGELLALPTMLPPTTARGPAGDAWRFHSGGCHERGMGGGRPGYDRGTGAACSVVRGLLPCLLHVTCRRAEPMAP